MTLELRQLEAVSHERPPGYVQEVLATGKVVGDTVELTDAQYRELVRKFSGRAAGCCGE